MQEINKKAIKEALKNEVNPLLIGLRNEIKGTNALLEKLQKEGSVNHHHINLKVNGKEIPEITVKDGYTPQFGIDYFTDDHIASFVKASTPKKGKDYFTAKEIKDFVKKATPKKNKDYFDGENGRTPVKGVDYFTKKEVKDFLKTITPVKGKDYFDGKKGEKGTDGINGKNGTEISAQEVRNKLESLKGKDRLKIKAIDGLEEILTVLSNLSSGNGAYPADSGASLSPTGVTPGSYTSANITVNAYGQITSASNGSGGGGGGTWGSITGTLSAQTDLQSALNAKLSTIGTGTVGYLPVVATLSGSNIATFVSSGIYNDAYSITGGVQDDYGVVTWNVSDTLGTVSSGISINPNSTYIFSNGLLGNANLGTDQGEAYLTSISVPSGSAGALAVDATGKIYKIGLAGLYLSTNGSPNSSQTSLNLVQDSGVVLTDYGSGVIGIGSVTTPGGTPGQLQFYDPDIGLVNGASNTYFSNFGGDFLLSTGTGFVKDASTRAEVMFLDASNLTARKTIFFPDAGGTFVLSVNGNTPDTAGNVTLSAGSGTVTSVGFTGGIISVATATTTPAFTVAGTSGGIPYFSSTSAWASSALLVANSLMIGGGAGTAPSTITTGTGVLTALGIAVNGSGAISLTTSPTFITPILGVASATSINKVTITAPATASTLTIANGKTLTVNNSITFAGTDSTTITMPTATSTVLANNLGISGGSTLIGGDAVGDKLVLKATSFATNTSAYGMINFYPNNTGTTPMMGMGENGSSGDVMIHFAVATASMTTNNYTIRAGSAGGGILYLNSPADTRIRTGNSEYIIMQNSVGRVDIRKPISTSITAGTGNQASVMNIVSAAHTALTASTEYIDNNFNNARILQFATGAKTMQRSVLFQAPTYSAVAATTFTDSATVAITGAPIGGTNATLTNSHALLIQAGALTNTTNGYGLTVNAPTGATNNYAAQFLGGTTIFGGTIRLKSYTVATLPAGVVGDVCYVTDQLTAVNAKGVAPTGGGAITCVQFYNGAGWVGI